MDATQGRPSWWDGVPETDPFLATATLVSSTSSDADGPTNIRRTRLFRTAFKYPNILVEERWDCSDTTHPRLLERTAMVADHLLVSLRDAGDERTLQKSVSALGGTLDRHLPNSRLYLVGTGGAEPMAFQETLARFQAGMPEAKVVEPDYVVHVLNTPNDPAFPQLWGLHNTGQTGGTADADIDAPEAWEATRGSGSVLVGVVDTGIDYTHPDLAANVWTNPGELPGNGIDDDGNGYVDDVRGWDFYNNDADPKDDNFHGTHVAGTIGAVGDNAEGISGVAPRVSLLALKFLSAGGRGVSSDAASAVLYATARGALLTCNSWGGAPYSQTLKDVITAAGNSGSLFIAAAGNEGVDLDTTPLYPGAYDNDTVITVAATDHRDALASFSNRGARSVDLAAPGVDILSAKVGGSYQALSGTSMAAPHVAGVCALVRAAYPTAGVATIKAAVLSGVDAVPGLSGKVLTGGRLNAARSLASTAGPHLTLADVLLDDTANGGNGDGYPSPGEEVSIVVRVHNTGAAVAPAVAVSASLEQSVAGVSVSSATSSLGDIAPGVSAENTAAPLRVAVASDAAEGTRFTLVLTASDTSGRVWTLREEFRVGTATTVAGRVTVAATGVGLANVLVRYSGSAYGKTTTAADGSYAFRVLAGTYSVTPEVSGYDPAVPRNILVPPGRSDVDFAVGTARLALTPASVSLTMEQEAIAHLPLSVANTGDAPVSFKINLVGSATTLGKHNESVTAGETGQASALPALPFEESFESGYLFDWTQNGFTGTREIVTTTASAGTRSFHHVYTGSGGHYQGISHAFTAGTRPGYIAFSIRPGSASKNAAYVALTDASNSLLAIQFYAGADGFLHLNNGFGEGDASVPYASGVWRRIELRNINWTTKTLDYQVDGKLVRTGVRFLNANSVTQTSTLWLYNYDTGSEAWWDAVSVRDSEVPWLTLTPSSGVLEPGASLSLAARFTSGGATPGSVRSGTIEFLNALNGARLATVPVELTITAGSTPTAPPLDASTPEDTAVTLRLAGANENTQLLTATVRSLPTRGTLYQAFDGTGRGAPITSVPTSVTHPDRLVIYVPPTDGYGSPFDSFSFTVERATLTSTPALVTIAVTPTQDPPIAVADRKAIPPGETEVLIAVLANDTDPDGDPLTITSFTQGAHGTVSDAGGGLLRYTAAPGFTSGKDSFTYTIEDGAGGSSTATVSLSTGVVAENPWRTLGGSPLHDGVVSGSLFGRRLQLAWTLQLTPAALNPAPIEGDRAFVTVANSDTYGTNGLWAVRLSSGSTDWSVGVPPTADAIGYLGSPATHGAAVYVQRAASATASAMNAFDASSGKLLWSTAQSLPSAGECLAPTITADTVFVRGGSAGGLQAFARDTGSPRFLSALENSTAWTPAVTAEGTPVSFVLGKIRRHDPVTGDPSWTLNLGWKTGLTSTGRTLAVAGDSAFLVNSLDTGNELVCVDLATGLARWRVLAAVLGTPAVSDGKVYVYDATGSVRVFDAASGAAGGVFTTGVGTGVAAQPIVCDDALFVSGTTSTAVLDRTSGALLQTLPHGGHASFGEERLLLASSTGLLACYVVDDGNQLPVALPQRVATEEDTKVTITLGGSDPEGARVTATITSLPNRGTLYQTLDGVTPNGSINTVPQRVSNAAGKVIYFPSTNAFGDANATFSFRLDDGRNVSATADVTIDVSPVNDAPVALDDRYQVRSTSELSALYPHRNDRDVDGDNLRIVAFDPARFGTLSQNPDGSLRYRPSSDTAEGTETLSYTIEDAHGARATANMVISVSPYVGLSWTQFGGAPTHAGYYPGRLGNNPWTTRWNLATAARFNAPAVSGGRVFVSQQITTTSGGNVLAVDARTGTPLWQRGFAAGTSLDAPAVLGDSVYLQHIPTSGGTLVSLNASTGAVRATTSFLVQDTNDLAPVATEAGIFLDGGQRGGLFAFDPGTNAQRFKSSAVPAYARWTPAVSGERLFSFAGGVLREHSAMTGDVLRTVTLDWAASSTVMNRSVCLAEARAFLINDAPGGSELVCIDTDNALVLWRTGPGYLGTPATADTLVYACKANSIAVHHAGTGALIAEIALGTQTTTGNLVLSEDLLFVPTTTDTFIFDRATGQLRQALGCAGEIALADDTVFVSTSAAPYSLRAFTRQDPGNPAPLAQDTQLAVAEDSTTAFRVSATDTNTAPLTYVVLSLPTRGTLYQTVDGVTKSAAITTVPTVVTHADNLLVYETARNANGNGDGTFTFKAYDETNASNVGTVTIDVLPVNDAPFCINEVRTATPGRTIGPIAVLDNDWDLEGDPLRLVSFTQPTLGSVRANGDGTLSYSAPENLSSGSTAFAYTIADSSGATAAGTVTVRLATAVGTTWATLGNNAAHDSRSDADIGRGTWSRRWRSDPVGTLNVGALKPAIVAGGRVFTAYANTSSTPTVAALDASTAAPLWSQSFAVIATPAHLSHHGARLYVRLGGRTSRILGLDASTGSTLWMSATANVDSVRPLLPTDTGVYFSPTGLTSLASADPTTGSALFSTTSVNLRSTTPAVLDNELYVFGLGTFSRHDSLSGQLLWTKAVTTTAATENYNPAFALSGRRAFLIQDSTPGQGDEAFLALDLDTQQTLWSVPGRFTGIAAVHDDIAYVLSGSEVQARHGETGTLLGSFACPAGTTLVGHPAVTDELLFAQSATSTFIFHRRTRALLTALPVGGAMALANGGVVVTSNVSPLHYSFWTPEPEVVLSPATGTLTEPTDVRLTARESDARLHYTLDGTAPTPDSPSVASGSSINIAWNGRLRVIAVKDNRASPIVEAAYTLNAADTDGDALPDWWERRHFGSLAVAQGSGDADQDGLSDLEEFEAGTSPVLASERLDSTIHTRTEDGRFVLRWESKPGRSYTVETSDDGITWTALSGPVAGSGGPMERSVEIPTPILVPGPEPDIIPGTRFCRLRVAPAP